MCQLMRKRVVMCWIGIVLLLPLLVWWLAFGLVGQFAVLGFSIMMGGGGFLIVVAILALGHTAR
jgi:hypothetical protein